jgi:hypothetical protein
MRMQAYVDSARAKEFEPTLPPALGIESALASQPAVKHEKEISETSFAWFRK